MRRTVGRMLPGVVLDHTLQLRLVSPYACKYRILRSRLPERVTEAGSRHGPCTRLRALGQYRSSRRESVGQSQSPTHAFSSVGSKNPSPATNPRQVNATSHASDAGSTPRAWPQSRTWVGAAYLSEGSPSTGRERVEARGDRRTGKQVLVAGGCLSRRSAVRAVEARCDKEGMHRMLRQPASPGIPTLE
eukprot:52638-Rhodomonas_salina.2